MAPSPQFLSEIPQSKSNLSKTSSTLPSSARPDSDSTPPLPTQSTSMAPSISVGIAAPSSAKKQSAGVDEAEFLRRRNAELEREVAALRLELGAARRRAETAEEAEERLCAQLGDAEVEGLELARAYQAQVQELARELAAARRAGAAR